MDVGISMKQKAYALNTIKENGNTGTQHSKQISKDIKKMFYLTRHLHAIYGLEILTEQDMGGLDLIAK